MLIVHFTSDFFCSEVSIAVITMMLLLVVIMTNFVLNVALWVSNLVSWQLLADFFQKIIILAPTLTLLGERHIWKLKTRSHFEIIST